MNRRFALFALLVALALVLVATRPGRLLAGTGGYSECGNLVQGVSCVLFQADSGNRYLLDNRGSFVVGDRVFVTGTLDPNCFTICLEGQGCIRNNTISSCDCASGNVNAGVLPVENVLLIDGSPGAPGTRTVTVAVGQPFEISLRVGSSGPSPATYVVYAWPGPPTGSFELNARGQRIGCFVNPTPFHPGQTPRPVRCLRGGLPSRVCAGVTEVSGPSRAPWTISLPRGFPTPATFTLQGIIEDAGSANTTGFSVTNAVTLVVM
jgi:hypothetical protein